MLTLSFFSLYTIYLVLTRGLSVNIYLFCRMKRGNGLSGPFPVPLYGFSGLVDHRAAVHDLRVSVDFQIAS